jgi:hypothetical protein
LEGDDHPGAIITSSRRVRRDTFSGHPHNIILSVFTGNAAESGQSGQWGRYRGQLGSQHPKQP